MRRSRFKVLLLSFLAFYANLLFMVKKIVKKVSKAKTVTKKPIENIFDVVIIGYQPWFLSPSLPITLLVHPPADLEIRSPVAWDAIVSPVILNVCEAAKEIACVCV